MTSSTIDPVRIRRRQQQLHFEAAIRDPGLAIDDQESKTRRVVTELARAASQAGEANDG